MRNRGGVVVVVAGVYGDVMAEYCCPRGLSIG